MGHIPNDSRRLKIMGDVDDNISFRNPPEGTDCPPALSVPIGHRSILAEVRAPLPPRHVNPVMQPHQGSAARGSLYETVPSSGKHAPTSISTSLPVPVTDTWQGGTMSRGNIGGKSTRMDAFTWLSSVKVGQRRESSGGPTSGPDSGNGSRFHSRSRPHSAVSYHPRSDSQSLMNDDHREGEGTQSLQDEYVTCQFRELDIYKSNLFQNHLSPHQTFFV